MIAIAAFAACLVVPRLFRALVAAETYRIYDTRQYALMIVAWWLLLASLALAAAAWLGPRRSARRLARCPGVLAATLACLAPLYELARIAGLGLALKLTTGTAFQDNLFWWIFGPPYQAAGPAGLLVLGGWIALRLTGAGRASPDWLDRSGRVLGLLWIVLGLAGPAFEAQTLFLRSNLSLNMLGD